MCVTCQSQVVNMIRLLFFGELRDVAGSSCHEIASPTSISQYFKDLNENDPALFDALSQAGIRQALNLVLLPLNQDAALKVGDELAFMPPFSGG